MRQGIAGYAYDGQQRQPLDALSRWLRVPDYRRRAIIEALKAGVLTQREIAREFNCSLALVCVARKLGA